MTVLAAHESDLFAANTALVGLVLRRRPIYDLRAEDEDRQEGYIGLLKAARLWDPARGVTFASFAYECIWKAIQAGRSVRYGAGYRRAVRQGRFYESPVTLDGRERWADQLADIEMLPEANVARDELILRLCDLLTERERIAVLDPDVNDAADRLGIKKAAVHKARVRAYERLRKIVNDA